jgi:hypothetical protein
MGIRGTAGAFSSRNSWCHSCFLSAFTAVPVLLRQQQPQLPSVELHSWRSATVTSIDFQVPKFCSSRLVAADPTILLRRFPHSFFLATADITAALCRLLQLSLFSYDSSCSHSSSLSAVDYHCGHSFASCYQSCVHRWSLSTKTAIALSARSTYCHSFSVDSHSCRSFVSQHLQVTAALSTPTAVSFPLESAAVTAEITSLSSPCIKKT